MSLLAGVLTVSVAEAPASAATTVPVSMTMTAGTFATQHGKPGAVPVITTPVFGGTETVGTGTFTAATLKFPTQLNATTPTVTGHTKSTETILVNITPGTVTATMTTAGQLSIGATLKYEVKITYPVTQICVSNAPVHVVLTSTTPYTATAQTMTVEDSTIAIPSFGSAGCALAAGTLSKTFSGPGGELGLTLHGALTVPSKGTPTTTTLSVTPASPQVAGTTVAFKATVEKTGALATKAAGSVTFEDGATVLGTVTSVAGSATLKTKALPVGTQSITATYNGGGGYAGSTSLAFSYSIRPAPTVTITNLPKSVEVGTTTAHPFTVTITNPSNGLAITRLFLTLGISGLHGVTKTLFPLQYERIATTWCTTLGTAATRTYVGAGSSCTLKYPASFASAADSLTTLHFRFIAPNITTYILSGPATIKTTLFTGSCTNASTCKATAPLSGSVAPYASGTVVLLPTTPLTSKIVTFTGRSNQENIRKTFDVGLQSKITPTSLTTTTLSAPRGTVTYAIDTAVVATHAIVTFITAKGYDKASGFSTATLTVGKTYTLKVIYNPATYTTGKTIYKMSSYTRTFKVVTAPTGTPFTCSFSGEVGGTVLAYASASGEVPGATLVSSTSTTRIPVSNASATLVIDPSLAHILFSTMGIAVGFSPATGSAATVTTRTVKGTTATSTAVTVSLSAFSGSVVVEKGAVPGTVIAVGVNKVVMSSTGVAATCTPATANLPAPVGTTEIAGTTLAASPSSPATQGTPVTLTATVYPIPATGGTSSQVQFFDNSKSVGTALVSTTGSSLGTAMLTLTTLAAGTHSFTATWTGAPSTGIPFNVSSAVPFMVNPTPAPVVTAPVVTTEPQSVGVKAGQTATFTAAASGSSPSVQWQVSSDGGKSWTDVSGATSDTYSLTATKGDNANQYRAVFTNSAGTATSNAATLYVTAAGYWLTASNGAVYAYGNLPFYGSAGNLALNKPIVGSAATPTGGGYWLVASDGGIFSYGSAQFYGSMGGKSLNAPIVGMAPTPTGQGYWEVASDGGIFAFGAAQFYGSMGGKALNQPVVGMAATPTGKGYDEVASDGGIFAFGAATFHGSTGSMTLNKPIVSMATTPTGNGYWLVASDGGIFAFGTAQFYGAAVGGAGAGVATSPVVGMAATTDGGGYLEVEANGRVVQFGDAALAGTALTQTLSGASIVGITS